MSMSSTRHPMLFRSVVLAAAIVLPQDAPLAQQETRPSVVGTVYAESGRALAGVDVGLDGTAVGRTDEAGNFRLISLSLGPHVLTLAADGFASRTFRFNVPQDSPHEIDIGAVMLAPVSELTTVVGLVTDSRTGEPIPAAVVSLDGSVNVATNISGHFQIAEVTPGVHLLQVKRIGFKRAMVSVDLPPGRAGVDLEISLDPVPVELPEVVVEGERTLYAYGRLRDFYERRSKGVGHFVIRWEIEKRKPRVVSDLLYAIPGLRITPGPVGRNTIQLMDPSFSCRTPLLFLDGVLIRGGDPDEILTPMDVEGIEIYTRISEVPPELSTQAGSACGVIAVWTR